MKNLNELGVQEMSAQEVKSENGGIVVVGACLICMTVVGLYLGRDIWKEK